jgi:hypothetical protein
LPKVKHQQEEVSFVNMLSQLLNIFIPSENFKNWFLKEPKNGTLNNIYDQTEKKRVPEDPLCSVDVVVSDFISDKSGNRHCDSGLDCVRLDADLHGNDHEDLACDIDETTNNDDRVISAPLSECNNCTWDS